MDDIAISTVLLIGGGGFLYVGRYIKNLTLRIQSNGNKTKAKIIDFAKERSKDTDGNLKTSYYPIVKFTDRNGTEITQQLTTTVNSKKINQYLEIIYLKKNNNYEIIINSEFRTKIFPMIFIMNGYLLLGIGLFWLIYNL